ncbi:hypothetical protein HQN64_01080 [Enterobacteriaceae bacterium BIT-l23]|uniref:T6SS effector BTH_I2691 family protein n=1 Tax=Jejubacter sp. L23 TaxID=3092086 RepID=UPI001584BDAB|nr:hypothetical protein [Enterobacteriaceae bacterium BIT-l23]
MACQGLCTTKGLTVLPVRYAVVPENIAAGLPEWANDARITGVGLVGGEKYALRALRQGYLYVFYEKGKQGTHYWQCYSVAPDGSLWLQQVASNPAAVDRALCQTDGHLAQNVEFMSIEAPDKCGNVWFAFSQYPWEQSTLDRYGTDAKARAGRMQKVRPSVTGAGRSETGTEANESSLARVLDYQTVSVSGQLPGPDDVKIQNVSRATSLWDPAVEDVWRINEEVVKSQSSLYPWAKSRAGNAEATATAMRNRSEGMTPLILPLWDPVGIVHELNGWSQDVLGRQAQFLRERELEFSTKTSLDALKTMMEDRIQARGEASLERNAWRNNSLLSSENLAMRRKTLEQRYQNRPEVLAQIAEQDTLIRAWREQNVPAAYLEDIILTPLEPPEAYQHKLAGIKAQVEQELLERPRNFNDARARSWAPYQACLNQNRLDNFATCYKSLGDKVNEIFQQRMVSVINWLDAPILLTTLDDFHCPEQRAGLFYQSAVTMAISGINSCPVGAQKIDAWWNEYSVERRENLLWRHVAANNPQRIETLEPLLTVVREQQDSPVTALNAAEVVASLVALTGAVKGGLDNYSLALEASGEALHRNASRLEVELYRTDAFIVTVGERVSRLLRVDRAGETLSTTAFRLIFLMRTGISRESAGRLVEEYLRGAPVMRQTILNSFSRSGAGLASEVEIAALKRNFWANLDEHIRSEKGSQEYRLARINGLLLVLNAIDFIWLCTQLNDDKKAIGDLLSSVLAMVSQTMNITQLAVEHGLKARPLTVAWIKGAGAVAGGLASAVSVYVDWSAANNELENNRVFLAGVIRLKAFVDGLTLIKSVGLLLKVIADQTGVGWAERGTGIIGRGLAIEIFGIRVLAVLMTWEAMVAITLLQAIAVAVSPDELELWCRKCVFGRAPLNRSLAEQNKALEAAIKDIV